MATRKMRMAKASDKDIETLIDFFNLMEIVEASNFCISDWEDDEDIYPKLKPYMKLRDFDYAEFYHRWEPVLATRWRRVVFGCQILIESCCDPKLSYLEHKPEMKAAMKLVPKVTVKRGNKLYHRK
jgi:hypothetical protein